MAKLTLADIAAGFGLITTYNANNALLEAALENTLSRDGTAPNTMSANFDMNSQRVVNLANAIGGQDAITLSQLNAASIVVSTVLGTAVTLADVGGFYTLDTAEGALAEIFEAPSETTRRVLELATQAETNTGTDDTRVITPLKLANATSLLQATEIQKGAVERATQAEVDAGTDTTRYVSPATLSATPAGASVILSVAKTADEPIVNNTMQDDNDLFVTLVSGKFYQFKLVLHVDVNGSVVPDFKYTFSVPGATTGIFISSKGENNQAGVATQTKTVITGTGVHTVIIAAQDLVIVIEGTMEAAASGTFQFRWAQNTTDAVNATTVKKGSTMSVIEIQ